MTLENINLTDEYKRPINIMYEFLQVHTYTGFILDYSSEIVYLISNQVIVCG